MSGLSVSKSLAWMGVTSMLGQVITWAVTIIVARILTPADYGLVALSGLFTVFAMAVSEMGVGASVIQNQEVTRRQMRELYGVSIGSGVIMFGIGQLAAPLMATFFSDPRLGPLVSVQSFVFLISAAKSMPRNILVRETRFDIIAKVETAARIATSICALGMVLFGAGYWAIAVQGLFVEFFQFLIFCRVERITPTMNIHFHDIRELLRFGAKTVVGGIIWQFYNMVDTAILGRVASKEFLGAYGFSKQLTNMPFEKIVSMVNKVTFPYLARRQSDLSQFRAWTLRAAYLQCLAIAPFFYLLYFCAEEAIVIILGPNWLGAVLPMKVFCIASVFKLIESYNLTCLTALGKINEQVRFVIMLLVLVGGGMLVWALTVGVESSIYVWITIYPVLSIMFCRVLMRALNLSAVDIFIYMRPAIVAQGVMISTLALTDSQVHGSVWFTAVVKCVVGAGAYGVSILILDYFDKRKNEDTVWSMVVNRFGLVK